MYVRPITSGIRLSVPFVQYDSYRTRNSCSSVRTTSCWTSTDDSTAAPNICALRITFILVISTSASITTKGKEQKGGGFGAEPYHLTAVLSPVGQLACRRDAPIRSALLFRRLLLLLRPAV